MVKKNVGKKTAKTKQKAKTSASAKAKAKITFRDGLEKYKNGELKLEKYQKIGILLLIWVLAGFAGWVWEESLNLVGHGEFVIKGGNLLPWLNIYAYGAMLIMLVSYKLRKHPVAVFIVSALATGLLELFAGWLVYTIYDGARYWDYRGEWWGIGNINGFVCPASALAFGLGALALMYGLLPWCIKIAQKMPKRAFLTLTITLFSLVMLDDITNLILKTFGLPTAMNFYESLGLKYK